MKTLAIGLLLTLLHLSVFAQKIDFDQLNYTPPAKVFESTATDLPANWEQLRTTAKRWMPNQTARLKMRNVEVLDSLYCYEMVAGMRMLVGRFTYSYNEMGQLETEQTYAYDTATETFLAGTQILYTYDEEGRETSSVNSEYLDAEAEYQPVLRNRSIYSDLAEPDTIYYESYQPVDTTWVTDYREVYTYENNLLTQIDVEFPSGTTFSTIQRGLFFYDEADRLIRLDVQEDMGSGFMTSVRQEVSNYVGDIATLITLNLVNPDDSSTPILRIEVEVENGFIAAQTNSQRDFGTGLWRCLDRVEYFYTDMGNIAEQSTFVFDSVGEDFLPATRSTTTALDTSEVFNQETIIEINLPEFKSYALSQRYLRRVNETGNLEYTEGYFWTGEDWQIFNRGQLSYDSVGNFLGEFYESTNPSSNILRPLYRTELEYDSLNRQTIYRFMDNEFEGVTIGDSLITIREDSLFYNDASNNVAERLIYRYDGMELVTNFRLTYSYNADDLRDTFWVESYQDTVFQPFYRYTYEYVAGLPVSEIRQQFIDSVYVNDRRTLRSYDDRGNQTSFTGEDWQDEMWQVTFVDAYTYDDADQLVTQERRTFAGSEELSRTLSEFTYNEMGEVTERLDYRTQETYDFVEVLYCEGFSSDFVSNTNAQIIPLTACPLPNPYVQGTAINCEQLEMGVRYDLEVISVDGKLVQRQQLRGGDAVQISGLPTTGLYFLNWTNENGQRWVQRLFVR